ncbi:HNH endonuclease [Paraburkholderia sp. BL21I4N1]|uniref:HNH endonuclease n=1 Tax=Paraburkholderia sp. BL21I4N1 TaxID=1938801 RepID=UPI000CFB89D5|nr:HNH endonuclease signature motif containing protein [Paraburkholderia sp. BL21I4N1]PQV45100.1 HNH endonuclease [Paraburkholderia sp. BL21I4N1]
MTSPRAWSFLTIEGTRQYGGNAGYDDNPAEVYRYDSNVANYRQVAIKDVVILRSRTNILGIAQIESIVPGNGKKARLRCPTCRISNIKERATMAPRWACKNRHLFDVPLQESVEVKTFEAHYGKTFRQAPAMLTLQQINDAVVRPSDQMSIKELDLAKLEAILISEAGCRQLVENFAGAISLDTSAHLTAEATMPNSIIEARRRVLREVNLRRGQPQFRQRLIQRYGSACQISRCDYPYLVEAAHIAPYALSNENGAHNGLLLRSDLHILFDLGMLAIHPVEMTISLHTDLMKMEYAAFQGQRLFLNGTTGPDRTALEARWEFSKRLDAIAATNSK